MDAERPDPGRVTVTCEECGWGLATDDPALRLELGRDGRLLAYCFWCWLTKIAD